MVNINPGGYTPYDQRSHWEGDRPSPNNLAPNPNFPGAEPPTTDPPTDAITRFLQEQLGIKSKNFFLALDNGDGDFCFISGPNLSISKEDSLKIFSRSKYLQISNRMPPRDRGSQGDVQTGNYADGYLRGGHDSGGVQHDHQWQLPIRRRRPMSRREAGDSLVTTTARRAIVIGNEEQVRNYYHNRFTVVQQTACKIIGKAFVKVIAPKKQANNPYTGGDATVPDWWPKPWGPGEKDKVRHTEPDHQWKKERVYLLVHILRMITEPRERQHPDIQRLDVSVAKLEEVAMESLRQFFEDPVKPNNAKKRPILKELFRVAKLEERYKRNEIDGDHQTVVMADDIVMDYCPEEPDDDDQNDEMDSPMKDSSESELAPSRASPQIMPPTRTTIPENMVPSLPSTSGSQILAAQLQSPPFMADLSIRGAPYAGPAMIATDLAQDQYSFQPSLQTHGPTPMQLDGLPSPQHQHHPDPSSRRSSMFTPITSDFPAMSPSSMYNSPWQHPSSRQQTPSTSHNSPTSLYAVPGTTQQHQPQQQQPQQPQQQQTILPPPPPLPLTHQHHHQQLPNPFAPHHMHVHLHHSQPRQQPQQPYPGAAETYEEHRQQQPQGMFRYHTQ